ncbi:hypothetical protein BBJ29_006503 [Phytophthora kernoviae]|uniref:Uncharacterized protein n=1 Tax=Phytophthora kernoviae TaxID=325452 RepID=A0A3F2RIN9_9STRA|nr:hypothetical protein BBJ29_006503 [Phytophthora kernoviae]RLN57817.1 hypothetical protein BBP00_00007330 [Phytophthora kernoviae]
MISVPRVTRFTLNGPEAGAHGADSGEASWTASSEPSTTTQSIANTAGHSRAADQDESAASRDAYPQL